MNESILILENKAIKQIKEGKSATSIQPKTNYIIKITCLSVRFKFRASSQRFCFDTYALNRNSFSNSSVWNLEYGLRFLRTVT